MQEERVEKRKLLQAARCPGVLSFEQIEAILLETNGKFNVIKTSLQVINSTLQNVEKSKLLCTVPV